MKKYLFAAILLFAFACKNADHTEEVNKDSTAIKDSMNKMNGDSMKKIRTSTAPVPDLPAVPDGAKVYFKNLKNNQTISSPVKVEMGIDKMKVDTAGKV